MVGAYLKPVNDVERILGLRKFSSQSLIQQKKHDIFYKNHVEGFKDHFRTQFQNKKP
jgi:hypothetical protein